MHMPSMVGKLFASFFILLIYIKISGKSQLAPLSAADQVGNMVVGALAGASILSPDVKLWESVVLVAAWAVLQLVVRLLKNKSPSFATLLDGRRIQLIKDGQALSHNFKQARLNPGDLENMMHQHDIASISYIKSAWFEPNGQISFSLKKQAEQGTLLISHGSIDHEGLENIEKEEDWLHSELQKVSRHTVEDIFIAEWYNSKLWVYPFDNPTTS